MIRRANNHEDLRVGKQMKIISLAPGDPNASRFEAIAGTQFTNEGKGHYRHNTTGYRYTLLPRFIFKPVIDFTINITL